MENALVRLGYDDVQDGDFIDSLEQFKKDVGMSAYNTYGSEVVDKLSEVYEEMDTIKENLSELGFMTNQETIAQGFSTFRHLMGMDECGGSVLDAMENVEDIKTVLEKTLFYDKGTETFKDALLQFNNAVSSDDNRAIEQIDKISDYLKMNENFASQLMELGFFNPESGTIEPTSVQADSAPSDINKCIENFCRVYGVEYSTDNMENIMKKIDDIHTRYTETLNSEETASVLKALEANAESQKINFSKSWTFLKWGMGFSNELASAVLANWFVEGVFSETNYQGGEKNTLDDSKTHIFTVEDELGFGIMQWSSDRRKTLLNRATEMESGVGNINSQFATFRYEIEEDRYEKAQWNLLLSDVESDMSEVELTREYAFNFYKYVERGSAASEVTRQDKAEIIYKGMVSINEKE